LHFGVLVPVNSLGFLPRLAIWAANEVSRWRLVAALARARHEDLVQGPV
jgi:hypothetical protein